jgi:hypothetical protein
MNVYTPDPLGVVYLQLRLAPSLVKEKMTIEVPDVLSKIYGIPISLAQK